MGLQDFSFLPCMHPPFFIYTIYAQSSSSLIISPRMVTCQYTRIRSPKMLPRKASLDHEKCYPKVQWRLYGHASETSINTFCIASILKGKQRGEKANS